MISSSNKLFKKSSTTYWASHLFFPKSQKEATEKLYTFVRTADNFVDQNPQDINSFKNFKEEYLKASVTKTSQNPIISDYLSLNIPHTWTLSFLKAMESDLTPHTKPMSYSHLLSYMYGSAEVIGLMMAHILKLDPKSHHYAKLQGRAMQLINFIRDIKEDNSLNRKYINPQKISWYLSKYFQVQNQASKGYTYIPKRYRIAIKTAADMYTWTAKKIKSNPRIIYQKSLRPSKIRVIIKGIINSIKI